jgi:hypothetical protein
MYTERLKLVEERVNLRKAQVYWVIISVRFLATHAVVNGDSRHSFLYGAESLERFTSYLALNNAIHDMVSKVLNFSFFRLCEDYFVFVF